METYGVFAATERLLMELGRQGADRQLMHEVIREHSLNAWSRLQEGSAHTLIDDLAHDERILAYLSPDQTAELLNADAYVGDAPKRAAQIAAQVRKALQD
jgi:adenylosuccinate lyase